MKNKKILFTVLFIILFCLLGFSKCFAATTQEPSSEETKFINTVLKENSNYNYYVIFSRDDNRQVIFYDCPKDDNFYFYLYMDNMLPSYYDSNPFGYNAYLYNVGDLNLASKNQIYFLNYVPSTNVYSNATIYTDADKSEIFFQIAPQEGIVAQQVEKIQLSQTLEEVLGILPLTLVVLVSLVGLRKALKMLETFLRQS